MMLQTGVEPATREAAVLILAPQGRDAAVAGSILADAAIPSTTCDTLAEFVAGLDRATCAITTQEAFQDTDHGPLLSYLAGQPPWSDVPIVLLTPRGAVSDAGLSSTLGNVAVLERPFRPAALVTTVRFAVRARRRQREAAAYFDERRQMAERQSLLIRELHHRVKNTLATVQGLLGASARTATSVDAFYVAFSDRVVSLAKTHDLLTEDYWQTAPLRAMLTNELGPYDEEGSGRIRLDGPAVELTADLAVPTGMALHELTTNAARFGALSVPRGRVEVVWELVDGADGTPARRLRLDWTEHDGPPTTEPKRRGFGSTLLQRVLTVQCGAEIAFDFRPAGLHFRMEAPLAAHRLVPTY